MLKIGLAFASLIVVLTSFFLLTSTPSNPLAMNCGYIKGDSIARTDAAALVIDASLPPEARQKVDPISLRALISWRCQYGDQVTMAEVRDTIINAR